MLDTFRSTKKRN